MLLQLPARRLEGFRFVLLTLVLAGALACESSAAGPGDAVTGDAAAGAPTDIVAPGDAATGDAAPGDAATGDLGAGADAPGAADAADDSATAPDAVFAPGTFVDDCVVTPLPDDLNDGRVLVWNGPGLRLGLVRDIDPDGFGTSGTAIFRARRLALETGSISLCHTDQGLGYEVSHHNFADRVALTVGDVRYELHMDRADYDSPWTDTLLAADPATDAPLWGPVMLALESCTPLTPGGLCQAGRREDDLPK